MIKLKKKIIKEVFVFILLFFVINSNSQDYKRIKKQNIVFIHYKDLDKNISKKIFSNNITDLERQPCLYRFYFSNPNYKHKRLKTQPGSFELHFRLFNSQSKKKELSIFRMHKSFLRKNKDIIIDMRFIKKIGLKKTLELLRRAKTILIIDDTHKIENKTILVKEVVFIDTGPI